MLFLGVLAAIIALGVLGRWLNRKNKITEVAPDLRRADDAERAGPYDPKATDDAVSRAFDETRPPGF